LAIFSVFGLQHRFYSCKRVCFSGEPYLPDLGAADLGISSHRLNHPRHHRFPLWALYISGREEELLLDPSPAAMNLKPQFCAFVVGHERAKLRLRFFEKLHARCFVHSAGRVRNNCGGALPPGPDAKRSFLQACRFNIAFENQAIPGYVTEKLVEPFLTHTIPIYWGAPDVSKDFDTRSFLHYRDFADEEALIQRVLDLEKDESARWELLRQPKFAGNCLPDDADPERLLDRIEEVLDSRSKPIVEASQIRRIGRRVATKWRGLLHQKVNLFRNWQEGNV
jgi:hypothetical protein